VPRFASPLDNRIDRGPRVLLAERLWRPPDRRANTLRADSLTHTTNESWWWAKKCSRLTRCEAT
jgi:hypothetical protein